MKPANYINIKRTNKYVLLRDLGPWHRHLTITNDAEAVVASQYEGLDGRRLLYWDSEGELTELIIIDDRFAGFKRGSL